MVNYVKTSALNTRLFARLCEDLNSDHMCLLYHTEVRWLSRGNITKRVFELRQELLTFFQDKRQDFKKNLENEAFILQLAYLSDIFQALNDVNRSFQGPDRSIQDFVSKLEAFVRKLDLWMKKVESKRYGMFEFLTTVSWEPNEKLSQEIAEHLRLLRTELMHYFPDTICRPYMVNSFFVDPALLPVKTSEQEEIIDIQADETANNEHRECSPSAINFLLKLSSSYTGP
ncbi:zinc finger BED domain-containing protein 5-like [Styela clava]